MEDIKLAVKKAKKEEKENPEFLLKLGYVFKRGEGTKPSEDKASKYFRMAAKLGNDEAMVQMGLYWWKYIGSRSAGEEWFTKAANLGNEEAQKYLDEILAEKQAKADAKQAKADAKQAKADAKQAKLNLKEKELENKENIAWAKAKYNEFLKSKTPLDLETIDILFPRFNPDGSKRHVRKVGLFYSHNNFIGELKSTILICPCCDGDIELVDEKTEGKLSETFGDFYDKADNGEEMFNGEVYRADKNGVTLTKSYKCKKCGFTFDKIINTKEERKIELAEDHFFSREKFYVYEHTIKISNVPTKECSEETKKILSGAYADNFTKCKVQIPMSKKDQEKRDYWDSQTPDITIKIE